MTDRKSKPHWFVSSSYCPGVYVDAAQALSTIDNITGTHVLRFENEAHAVHALRVAIRERTLIPHPIPSPISSQLRRAVLSDKGRSPEAHYVIVIQGFHPGVFSDADSALRANDNGTVVHFVRASTKSQAYDIWREAIESNKVLATTSIQTNPDRTPAMHLAIPGPDYGTQVGTTIVGPIYPIARTPPPTTTIIPDSP